MEVGLNSNMHFEQVEEQVRVVSDYEVDGNRWTIDLLGLANVVSQITVEPRVIVHVVSENDSLFGELREALFQEGDATSNLDEKRSPQGVDTAYSLQVRISLDQIASPENLSSTEQYWIGFIHFDPKIYDRKHLWTFDFRQKIVDFKVEVSHIHGRVGSKSWLIDGNYVGQAEIERKDGNPAEYEIKAYVGFYREI